MKKLFFSLLFSMLLMPSVVQALCDFGNQVTTQNAVTVTGNGVRVPVIGYSVVAVDILDTTTSYTIIPEFLFTPTSGAWRAETCYDLTGTGIASFSTGGGGTFRCNVTAANLFRTRVSAINPGVGSLTVRVTPIACGGVLPSN